MAPSGPSTTMSATHGHGEQSGSVVLVIIVCGGVRGWGRRGVVGVVGGMSWWQAGRDGWLTSTLVVYIGSQSSHVRSRLVIP